VYYIFRYVTYYTTLTQYPNLFRGLHHPGSLVLITLPKKTKLFLVPMLHDHCVHNTCYFYFLLIYLHNGQWTPIVGTYVYIDADSWFYLVQMCLLYTVKESLLYIVLKRIIAVQNIHQWTITIVPILHTHYNDVIIFNISTRSRLFVRNISRPARYET